jgi:hypothetical protein
LIQRLLNGIIWHRPVQSKFQEIDTIRGIMRSF